MKELNNIIDNHMARLPSFQSKELHIGNEQLNFHFWDMLQCIRTLYGDLAFAQYMAHSLVQYYTSTDQSCPVVNEMHTDDCWWLIQVHSKVIYNDSGNLVQFAGVPQGKTAGYNCCPDHFIVGQDSTNALSGKDGISHIANLFMHVWKRS